MKTIVHIGTEKTGTSSIQEFLHRNRDRLADQGVAHLRSPGPLRNWKLPILCMEGTHADRAFASMGVESQQARRQWKADFEGQFHREITDLPTSIHTVVISAEHFHSRIIGPDEVRRLATLLEPHASDIEILAYLRRQDQVAVSKRSTLVRTGAHRDEVLGGQPSSDDPYYDYFALAERWSSVFGRPNILLRRYHDLLEGDLLTDFMAVTGIDAAAGFDVPERINETLSSAVQDAVMRFNKAFSTSESVPRVHALRAEMIEVLGARYPGPARLPTRAQAQAFYDVFRESNERLAERYFSGRTVFSEDFSRYPEQEENPDPSVAGAVLDDLLAMMADAIIDPTSEA